MVVKIPGKQIVVNPVETNRSVTGGINTPNVMGGFGVERKFAEMTQQNILKYNNLKLESFNQFAQSYQIEDMQDCEDIQLSLKTESSYEKNSSKYAELLEKRKARRQEFEKQAKAMGMPQDLINAALEGTERNFGKTQAIYGKYETDYWEEESKKRNILLFDEQSSLASKTFLNGNLDEGMALYQANQKKLREGFDKGYITADQYVRTINLEKQNAIGSYVMSLVANNNTLKLAELEAMKPTKAEEFFKGLTGTYGDYDVIFDADDYDFLQRSLSSAKNSLEQKAKAQQELTLAKDDAGIQYRKKNNYKIESVKYPSGINPSFYGKDLYLASTNNYYNTQFKNSDEARQLGYRAKFLDDSNTQELFYNDLGVSGVEIANKNVEENYRYVGGMPEIDQEYFRNSMSLDYKDRGVKTAYGYNTTKLLSNPTSETFSLISNLYTPNARKLLDKTKNVKLDITYGMSRYENTIRKVVAARPQTSPAPVIPYGATMQANYKEPEWEVLLGEQYQSSKYTDLTIFGTMEGLKYLSQKGDINAQATVTDMENIAQDFLITSVLEKTGGILSEDVADDLGMKSNAGLIITELGVKEQTKVYNYYLQNDEEIQKDMFNTLTPAFKEILGDKQIGDMGNGVFVEMKGVSDIGKEVRSLRDFLWHEDFKVPVGKNADGSPAFKIVKGNELVPISRGDNTFLITYKNMPVLLNGSVAVYKVGDN